MPPFPDTLALARQERQTFAVQVEAARDLVREALAAGHALAAKGEMVESGMALLTGYEAKLVEYDAILRVINTGLEMAELQLMATVTGAPKH